VSNLNINILDYFQSPKGGYLTGTHETMCDAKRYPTRIVEIKSKNQKFPTDTWAIKIVNGKKYLCFFQTENGEAGGWKDVSAFKINTNSLPVFCPLILESLPWVSEISQPTVMRYVKALWDGQWAPVGDVHTEILQPYPIDWGGDVGIVDVLPIHYYWGPNGRKREIFSLSLNWGHIGWALQTLGADGLFHTDKDAAGKPMVSIFNKFVAGLIPEPVFGFPDSWLP